jgi:iron complex outermembrane receptor protein
MNKTALPKTGISIRHIRKIGLIMRLSVVLFLFSLQVSANGFAQKLTLHYKNTPLVKILGAVEEKTNYRFVYSNQVVEVNQKVDINVTDVELTEALDKLFEGLSLHYKIVDNKLIIISDKQHLVVGIENNALPVKGTVTAQDGSPIQGVSITILGTSKGTSTDERGNFEIQANDGDVLIISSVGYISTRVKISGSAPLNLTLVKSENSLGEVVVTALGIKREAKSLGYSNQKVTGNDVIKADPPNIAQGLMGKAAGLNITIPNGVEGSSSRIVIRGNNSLLGNNQPLIVVDGVMVDNEQILPGGQNLSTNFLLNQNSSRDAANTGGAIDYGSFLNTINADDVESFNILKGPTAAALYGARGANGVILITTKKGSKQKGLGLNYNLSQRWNDPYRYMNLQHEYGSGMTTTLYSANTPFVTDGSGHNREFTENDQYGTYQNIPTPGGGNAGPFYNYIGFPGDGASWGPKMEGQPLVWWDGTTRPYTANPNIFKSFYKTGNTVTNNVSFSGGGDVGTLRASYTRSSNNAITYNSNYTQNVFNIGSSINVSKKVKAEVTLSYTNTDRLNAPNLYGENNQQITSNGVPSSGVGYITTYHLPADYKPLERGLSFNPDGSRNTFVPNNSPYPSSSVGNYWWTTFNNNTTFTQNQLLGSIKLSGDILPWLNATGHVGEDYYTNQFETKVKPIDAAGLLGGYSNDLSSVSTQNIDGMLTAHQNDLIKDFDASFSVGASYYHYKLYDLSATNPGPFNYPFTYNLNNYAGTANNYPRPTENRSESEINSVYGILNLTYKKFLFLELSGRNDWSSTLPASKWSFFYPSASLSFVFTDAFKLDALRNWLSYGKLRLAEAASANGYVPYGTVFTYSPITTNGFTTGLSVPSTLPSLSIRPQQARSFEIGTDLGFLNNRINFNFTYYDIYSYNQILPVSIASSSGANQLTINTGALRNRGIEFIINVSVFKSKDFSWDIGVNGAHNNNKVVSIAPGIDQLPLGSWFGGDGSNGGDGVNMNARVGDDYGTIYGYDYRYLNGQKVVNLLYADGFNTGNGPVVGAQYATDTTGFVKIGNATPKITGGIANTFSYKNWSLYIMTDFSIGGQIWSGDYASIMGQGEAPETVWERDGHGLPYTFPDGSTANVGVILPGVTVDAGGHVAQNTAVVNSWWKYAGNYQSWDNQPIVRSNSIFTNSWGKLRELSLTYRLPAGFIAKTKIFQNLSVSLIGRDLFYLFTKLPDRLNPEGLVGTTNVQGIQFGELPGVRSYGFSIKAGF